MEIKISAISKNILKNGTTTTHRCHKEKIGGLK
jgi:hypothetical protein